MESVRMKVLIIDDQVLFAEGMKYLLESFDSSIETNYAADINSALNQIMEQGYPDLILLDINLNGNNDFCLIDKLNRLNSQIPLLIISTNTSVAAAGMAIERGASGFIPKSCGREVVLEAIQTVLSGKPYLVKERDVHQSPLESEMCGRVTSRQQEILYLLSLGLLNKQIASELNISANTVKAHLHDLFKHLNVSNRTAAVKNGQKYGLL
jgi:DNA-binding NarL/FixJ family response regulator